MKRARPLASLSLLVLLGGALLFCASFGCSTSRPPESFAAVDSSETGEASIPERTATKTRLVVWITVDQMRGDYLRRYESHFSERGFRRLMTSGVWYQEAHYGHAITETAPGHATLFTGVAPSEHGIIGNSWLTQDGGEVTSVSDPARSLITPWQDDSKKGGASPHRLLAATVGDQMKNATSGRAQVVAVSIKDRSAILPAGQKGQAYWMGEKGFVTSDYYLKEAPAWLIQHQSEHPPESYIREGWPLARPESEYKYPLSTSVYAPDSLGLGFPHAVAAGKDLVRAVVHSPWGDRAVLDLALRVMDEFEMGKDSEVDLLSISFSSPDIIGHAYGPESREMEDCFLRLDDGLGELFSEIDRKIGWEHTLVVLSADHGGSESAEYLTAQGLKGRRLTEGMLESEARRALKTAFGHDRYLLGVSSPYVSLNEAALRKDERPLSEVLPLLVKSLQTVPGVLRVYEKGADEFSGEHGASVAAAMHPERSGHLYVVPEEYTLFLQDEDLAATHGSPFRYDTHVPVLFAGSSLKSAEVSRAVDVRSIAVTVAGVIGVPAPEGATFSVLSEVFSGLHVSDPSGAKSANVKRAGE